MIAQQTSPSLKLTTILFSASIALLAATGCHKKAKTLPPPSALPPSTSAPAPTASITADPQAIDQGQSVVLNWRTTNATSVSIDGIGDVAVNGTQTVSPASSTNFHLVAKGDGGTTEANVRVTVRVATVPTDNGDHNRHHLRLRLPRRSQGSLLRLRQLRHPSRRRVLRHRRRLLSGCAPGHQGAHRRLL